MNVFIQVLPNVILFKYFPLHRYYFPHTSLKCKLVLLTTSYIMKDPRGPLIPFRSITVQDLSWCVMMSNENHLGSWWFQVLWLFLLIHNCPSISYHRPSSKVMISYDVQIATSERYHYSLSQVLTSVLCNHFVSKQ